ncbi:MAG: T9SS type A sorting domain-containing protein [Bacteroidetes bacterium]|nr:T9SS type A sorting domain-containing protein [Bacteroidota bacterium]
MKLQLLSLFTFLNLLSLAQNPIFSCKGFKTLLPEATATNSAQALNTRSDTFDILKYTINLEITDFTNKKISGNTIVRFAPKLNGVNYIDLDLYKLTVDSVKLNSNNLSFTYNAGTDSLLHILLGTNYNTTDTLDLIVYYNGSPAKDPSGWGGFYFQSGYAFNLGVGYSANPHNYGRVWFPCFDNFVERSKYEFNITTNSGKRAYCNGYLSKDTLFVNGNRISTWVLEDEIPTYLACVAVANYTHVSQIYNGVQRNIPIWLTAAPADTTNLKNAFINLKNALAGFENDYAPYAWNKVGYSLVPFSSGAMEHATNIAYPQLGVAGGSTGLQDLMAHELAHHWWGDLITCETAEDMWINEGMATYSEHIFFENLQGKNAYKNQVRTNHEDVLHFAHIEEAGYRAISGIPHQYTYGKHVYNKGASVAHTLRGYLGDSLFFVGLQHALNTFKFTHVNSTQLLNDMSTATGVPLTNFLNEWVLGAGFPHFSIDSSSVAGGGANNNVTVYIKQKLTGAPNYFTNVPIEITFKNAQWQDTTVRTTVSGKHTTFTISLPFAPTYIALNLDEKINDAIAPDYKTIKSVGTYTLSNARMTVIASAVTDSTFLRVEHNYTAPDPYKASTYKYRISPNRYWKVDGIIPAGFKAKGRINYDGRTNFSGNGYLDNALITTTEDSLVLLYRKNAADDWQVFPYYTKSMGINTDKAGLITIDSLFKGEYVFAMQDKTAGLAENKNLFEYSVYPNPTNGNIYVEIPETINGNTTFEIINSVGAKVLTGNASNFFVVDTKTFDTGMYLIRIKKDNLITTKRFVVIR